MAEGQTKLVAFGITVAAIVAIVVLVDRGHQPSNNFVSNDVPPPDYPNSNQAVAQPVPAPPPMFQVKYDTSVGQNFLGGIQTWRNYSLQNTGEQSEEIKWIAINNRGECLAVPVWNYDKEGIRAMEVLSENSDDEVADFLRLEVGQATRIKMPENCGEPIRLKVGTNRGEYDIGPLTFF